MTKDFFSQPLTYEKLDALSEYFKELGLSTHGWYPSLEDIEKYIKPNLSDNIGFIFFILETAGTPQTEEQKRSRQILLNLFNENTNIVAEEDDFENERFDSLCNELIARFCEFSAMWENVTNRSLLSKEKERLRLCDASKKTIKYTEFLIKRSAYKRVDKSIVSKVGMKFDIY